MENKETLLASSLSRSLALWEIVSIVSSGLIVLWGVQVFADRQPLIGAVPIVLAVGLMIFSQKQRGETLRDLGFRMDNLWPSLRMLVAPTLIAITLIVMAIWLVNGYQLSLRAFRTRLLFVPFWALFQQYALQGFINRRAMLVFGPGLKSNLLVGIAFAILHLPSPPLTLLALIGGGIWGNIYQKQPNLFAIMVSHTAVSLVLSLLMPPTLTPFLRIGFKYFGLVL